MNVRLNWDIGPLQPREFAVDIAMALFQLLKEYCFRLFLWRVRWTFTQMGGQSAPTGHLKCRKVVANMPMSAGPRLGV